MKIIIIITGDSPHCMPSGVNAGKSCFCEFLVYVLNSLFFRCRLMFFCVKFFVFGFFCMFWYACGMYERLYGCLCSIKVHDMSKKGHIVYVSYTNTEG